MPALFSESYAVIDSDTGQPLLGRLENERMYPASTTKILTVAIILESHSLEEHIIVMPEALNLMQGATSIALVAGERVSVRDMVYATMVASANDAANVLAIYHSGSIEQFAALMNQKARETGAHNSNFVNPSGLHDPNHYTTAADMAKITRWAMSVRMFSDVFSAERYVMPKTNLTGVKRELTTAHSMLGEDSEYYYKNATGGKLGWTPESRHTSVTAADIDGTRLICVSLGTTVRWEKFLDTKELFDYCSGSFTKVPLSLSGRGIPENIPVADGQVISLKLPGSVNILLPNDKTGAALEVKTNIPATYQSAAEVAPTVSVYMEGKELLSMPLYYTVDSSNARLGIINELLNLLGGAYGRFMLLPAPIRVSVSVILFTALLAGLIWLGERLYRKKQRKKLLAHMHKSLFS